MTVARAAALAASLAVAGCSLAPPGSAGPAPETLPPPGYGTLRQDEVTLSFTSGDLQVKVTPLAESVLVTVAPDTYRRLQGLAAAHGPRVAREAGSAAPTLFLVSFFSDRQGTTFVPEEVQLRSLGVRLRPATIVPVTPGFGQRRLEQRETEMAVYAFDGEVDLESDLVAMYGLVENNSWATILARVQAERARARGRAAGPGGA
ncbi:MAG: hypothetical protein RH859_07295 [Longimicrobiales bacterium]